MPASGQPFNVRAEDRDWQIYHIIAENSEITVDEICKMAGREEIIAEESLERLQRYGLISRKGEKCAAKSIQQILISAELERTMKDSPIYMENGVIKVRKDRGDE
jgi:predicted transcriptional regulator